MGSAEIGEALLRPAGRAGAVRLGACPGLDCEAGEHVVFRRDRGEPETGEALLRPGERAGAVRRLPRPQLHRSWVSSKNPGGGVDPECRWYGKR